MFYHTTSTAAPTFLPITKTGRLKYGFDNIAPGETYLYLDVPRKILCGAISMYNARKGRRLSIKTVGPFEIYVTRVA